jgi:6-phosphogluconolactonase (cycloisomerase 2 family)
MTFACKTLIPRRVSTFFLLLGSALGWQHAALASTPPSRLVSQNPVSVAPVTRFVYVGNHDSRNMSAYRIGTASGALTPLAGSPFAVDASPVSVTVSPDGRFLFLAGDTAASISVFQIEPQGALKEVTGSPFATKSTPREVAIDHAGSHLYSTGQNSGTVEAFAIDAGSGRLSALAGSPFHLGHVLSGIAVGAGDRFLYVSDAVENSLSAFALNQSNGGLVEAASAKINTGLAPGKIALSTSGASLYVANSGSDSISVFSIDPVHGALTAAHGSPLETIHSPGDLLVTSADSGLFVASSQAAGLSGITIDSSGAASSTAETPGSVSASAEAISDSGSFALAGDLAGHFLFTADATTDKLTRYLIDPNTHQLVAGSGLSYETGESPRTIAVANTVGPEVTGSISVSLASESLLTFSATTGTVTLSAPATDSGTSGCAGQVVQLAFSVPSIGVISTASENPATGVCVLTGKTTAAFNVATAANSGSATLTAFATGFTDGITNLSVSLRTISLSMPTTNIGIGATHAVTGTIVLANPAPAGGVTITLASSAVATATVTPASVSIAANATSGAFTVDGVQANTATISASVPSGGYTEGTIGVTVLPPGKTINLPHSFVVAPGQKLPYPISIGAPATAPVNVTLGTFTGNTGTVTFSSTTVMIPAGATTPPVEPTITGDHIGSLNATGTASGYAPDVEGVDVIWTVNFNPDTLSVETGTTGNLTVSSSAVAPAGGDLVLLASANMAIASVPASVTIPAGSSSISVPIKGVAAGTTTVSATPAGGFASAAMASITVYSPPTISLYGPSGSSAFTVGKDGVVGMGGSLGVAAPAHNLVVTLTTPSTSSLLLSTTATGAGSHSIAVTVPAASTSIPGFYAQATANSGSTVVTATATGYSNGTATATMTPSGFILQGGTATTTLAGTSPVEVTFVQLAPSTLVYAGSLTLRAGAAPITVALKDGTPAVGTLGSSSIVFTPGSSQLQTAFQPVAAGTDVISFNGTPAGYSASASYPSTTYTVTEPTSSVTFCNGYYIATSGSVPLGYNGVCAATPQVATAAPLGGKTITLTSSSPNLLLSTSATAVGTVGPITLKLTGGSYSGPQFYVQALASSGTATITESIPGYSNTVATVDFAPSGFIVQGGTSTSTLSTTSPVDVTFVQLNPSTKAYAGTLTMRPGVAAFKVNLIDSKPTVGTLGSTFVTFAGGDSQEQTTFQPVGAGTAVIGFASPLPTGYTASTSYATTTFTVTEPASSATFCNGYYISGTGSVPLGYNSICAGTAQVATAAPAGGVTVTLTSSNPSKLLLSTSPTTVGTASVTVNIPAGSYSAPQFYAQILASSGSATITEAVTNSHAIAIYTPTVTTVDFNPSGFIVQGGSATTTFSGSTPVTLTFSQLNPSTKAYAGTLTMRPGAPTITVGLSNSNTAAGTLASSSIAFAPGNSQEGTNFQPVGAGTSVIGFSSPSTLTAAGYSIPSNYATTTFTVTAPNSSLTFCNGYYASGTGTVVPLGYNSSCATTPQLATAAPTGGRTITVTSSDPSKLLLSTSATAVGTASVTVKVPAGSYSASQIYSQVLVGTGSATITESVPGYNPTTATINFAPSGFIVQGGTTTTTFSTTSAVTVTFVQLDPTTLDYAGTLILRPGVTPATVKLIETNNPPAGTPAVGSLASNSLTFPTGSSQEQTNFQPAAAGTAVISFGAITPAGYTTPSNYQTTTFTVTAPNTSVTFCNGYYISTTGSVPLGFDSSCAATPQLAAPAPSGGRIVTLTSNSPNLLLSKTATAVGTVGPITVSVPAGSYSGPQFYVQALASSGSATITETVPGYNSTVATVTFAPTGFIVQGGSSTTTLSPASQVTVTFSQLDPNTLDYAGTLTLSPGVAPVTVTLKETDSPAGVGSLSSTALVFNPGAQQVQSNYKPTGTVAGTSLISATYPSSFKIPTDYANTTFTVTAPATYIQPVTIGNYMQATTYAYLAQPVPTGGRTVTITAPSSLLLSTSDTVKGTSSLSFNLTAGQSSTPTFYVQSQGGGAGTVDLSIALPSYAPGAGAVTVDPSGFALQGSNFTTTTGDDPTTLTIVPAALDPTYLNIYQVQELVPNVTTLLAALHTPSTPTGTLALKVESGTAPVGAFSIGSVTFKGADNPNFLTSSFEPKDAGTALITITSPAGFTNASTEITATVVAP